MNTPTGRILGIDYGTKRIGIAISDPLNIIARSIGTVQNDKTVVSKIAHTVQQYNAQLIVIGMPFTLRGEKSSKAREVEEFIQILKEKLDIGITTIDERFTSSVAQQTLLMMGTTKKQRRQKGRIDEMAAALILQSYLDRKK